MQSVTNNVKGCPPTLVHPLPFSNSHMRSNWSRLGTQAHVRHDRNMVKRE
jgi:hypothetical protein